MFLKQEKPEEMDDFEKEENFWFYRKNTQYLKFLWIPLQKFHKIFLHILFLHKEPVLP